MATAEELADEALRTRKVRQVVDISANLIMQGRMSRPEAEALVRFARQHILTLFPDGEQAYEVIYAPRFRRLIDEFAVTIEASPGRELPFAPRQR